MDAPGIFSAIFAGLALILSFAGTFIAYDARKAADRSADSSDRSAKGAERSADSAERANDINLHESRLDIFKGFQAFHGALVQKGPMLREGDVWPFLRKAHLAEFYFDEALHKRLLVIGDNALAAVIDAEALELANQTEGFNRPTKTKLRAVLNERLKALRTECAAVDVGMRAELRLHRPKGHSGGAAPI